MPRDPEPREDLQIEYVSIDTIMGWPGNAKKHDIGAIAASVLRHGFRDPLAVNRRTHQIEEGHGRIETLRAFKQQQRPAPSFIRVDEMTGEWLVPVLYFDDDDLTAHSYSLAHNRTHDLGGGYDEEMLRDALIEQARYGLLPGTGYDSDDLDALSRKLASQEAGDVSPQLTGMTYRVIIDCTNEMQQTELLDRFRQEGLSCRALIS